MDTKDNMISADYIRVGERKAFIKAMDKLKRHRFTTIITIVALSLGITYIILLSKFFMLLKTI